MPNQTAPQQRSSSRTASSPVAPKTGGAKTPSRVATARKATPDAVRLLRADHREVEAMFDEYERLRSAARKRELADKICTALEVHTTIEEELFYPAVRKALRLDDQLDEAKVEHDSAKELIAQIRQGKPEDDLFDAKVKVLGEYIHHHVKEEQTEMFPKVNASGIDTKELGARMAARKEELMSQKTMAH